MKGEVQICRGYKGLYVLAPLLSRRVIYDARNWLWRQEGRDGNPREVLLCETDFHRILPGVRLKRCEGPLPVLMLGIPLNGLTATQRKHLREAADDVEWLAEKMRAESAEPENTNLT